MLTSLGQKIEFASAEEKIKLKEEFDAIFLVSLLHVSTMLVLLGFLYHYEYSDTICVSYGLNCHVICLEMLLQLQISTFFIQHKALSPYTQL